MNNMVIWTNFRRKYKYSAFKYNIVGSVPEAIMHQLCREGKKTLLDVFFPCLCFVVYLVWVQSVIFQDLRTGGAINPFVFGWRSTAEVL